MHTTFYKIETKNCKVELAKNLASAFYPKGVFVHFGTCPNAFLCDSAKDLFNKAYVEIIQATNTLFVSYDGHLRADVFALLRPHLDKNDLMIKIERSDFNSLDCICFSLKSAHLKYNDGEVGMDTYGILELASFAADKIGRDDLAIQPNDSIGNILDRLFNKSLSDEASALLISGLHGRVHSEVFNRKKTIDDHLPKLVDYPLSLSSFILYIFGIDTDRLLISAEYIVGTLDDLALTRHLFNSLNANATREQLNKILKINAKSVLLSIRGNYDALEISLSVLHILLAKLLSDRRGSIALMKENTELLNDKVIFSDTEVFKTIICAFKSVFWAIHNSKNFGIGMLLLWGNRDYPEFHWLQECISRALNNNPKMIKHFSGIISGYFYFSPPIPASHIRSALEAANFASKYGDFKFSYYKSATMINTGSLDVVDLAIKHLDRGTSKEESRENINNLIDELKPKLSDEHIKRLSIHLKYHFEDELKVSGLNKFSIEDWMGYSESNKIKRKLVAAIINEHFTEGSAESIAPIITRKKQVIFAVKELGIDPYSLMLSLKSEKLKGYCMSLLSDAK